MSEWTFVLFVGLKLLLLAFFCMCYVIGGRSGKWVRRFIGGIGFGAGMIGLSLAMGRFNWVLLGLPVLYPIGLSIGYGADTLGGKILKRCLYGSFFGIVGLVTGIFLGNLYLGLVQFFISVAACTFLGVLNPVRAVDEEAMIALAIVIHVPFML